MRLCAYPYRKQGKNHPKLDLIREENDLQDRFLHMMYSHAAGRAAMQPLVQSFVSRAAGCFLDSRLSVPLVAPFVKKNHISLKECTAKQFISFNDFFVRKLKMDARPFSNAPQDFISPCDARLTVYPIHENGKFEIKNTEYTLEQLLRDRKLAYTMNMVPHKIQLDYLSDQKYQPWLRQYPYQHLIHNLFYASYFPPFY